MVAEIEDYKAVILNLVLIADELPNHRVRLLDIASDVCDLLESHILQHPKTKMKRPMYA